MRPIGFSTGSLAYGNFRHALQMMDGQGFEAVELSALREHETEVLIQALPNLSLTEFTYISFHAPSRLEYLTESKLASLLSSVAERQIPIVLHPDVICDWGCWRDFGRLLLVENMDKRKPIGRTAIELERIFERLPEAGFCLDLGHARQVDSTMSQTGEILRKFAGKLVQLHVSEVNSRSHHEPLNTAAVEAFRSIAHLIPPTVPAILETPVSKENLVSEAAAAREALTVRTRLPRNVHALA